MTPQEAAKRLEEIQADIDKNGSKAVHVPLRERLDLYYLATGTTAKDYEPDEEDEE